MLFSQIRFWILADFALKEKFMKKMKEIDFLQFARRKISFEVTGDHTGWIEGTILEFKELSSLITTCPCLAFQFKSSLYNYCFCMAGTRNTQLSQMSKYSPGDKWEDFNTSLHTGMSKINLKRKTQEHQVFETHPPDRPSTYKGKTV